MFDLEPTAKLICLTSEQLHVLLDYTREYFEQKHNRPEPPARGYKGGYENT